MTPFLQALFNTLVIGTKVVEGREPAKTEDELYAAYIGDEKEGCENDLVINFRWTSMPHDHTSALVDTIIVSVKVGMVSFYFLRRHFGCYALVIMMKLRLHGLPSLAHLNVSKACPNTFLSEDMRSISAVRRRV